MQRPQLARLIDIAEKREMFSEQVRGTAQRLQAVLEAILLLPDAPKIQTEPLPQQTSWHLQEVLPTLLVSEVSVLPMNSGEE